MDKIRYVLDTVGLISYFQEVFESEPNFNGAPSISEKTKSEISRAILPVEGNVLLSVPSIVFIEMYEKLNKSEEFFRKFYYEVFVKIRHSPNVEIRALDEEVLGNLFNVGGCLRTHELQDKIIVASAMTLECPIITNDPKIIEFVGSGNNKISRVVY